MIITGNRMGKDTDHTYLRRKDGYKDKMAAFVMTR
jgi:hypothetical protein